MPRSEPHHAPHRRTGGGPGRMMLAAAVLLAASGAVVLAVTDDARWLRLGVLAALWAALAGAFAAARYRREVAAGHDNGDGQLRIYQLELEREVAARREHELQVEADTRRRLEAEVRAEVHAELDGLRTELRALRQNLEALLGGEVLVERVALRAESTRLRSLSDESRAARTADRALPSGGQHTPPQPHRAGPPWPQRSGSQRSGPPRSGPQRVDPSRGRGPAVEPAERTVVTGRYQPPAEVPPVAALVRAVPDPDSKPPNFRPLRRAEPVPAGATGPAATSADVDPLTSPDWDRFEQWTPSEPPHPPPAALADGGGGRRRRAEEQASTGQAVTAYNGGRRRATDTGAHATSRSVADLLAAYQDDRQPRRRHGRADG